VGLVDDAKVLVAVGVARVGRSKRCTSGVWRNRTIHAPPT